MYLGACWAINTIPISPMAPVWASRGLLNTTCPAQGNPKIHTLPTLAHFSPEEGGHQDKQSVLMTDPCQTEDNYGNGVLKDTVSLKPIVSTPTTTDSFPAACSCYEVCVCVCAVWISSRTSVSKRVLCPCITPCNCARGCWVNLQRCRDRDRIETWDRIWGATHDWGKPQNALDSCNLRSKLLKILT